MKKPNKDFLDEVVDEEAADKGRFGAKLDDEDTSEEDDEDEEAGTDRIVAAKAVRKALASSDDEKLAEALKAFVACC